MIAKKKVDKVQIVCFSCQYFVCRYQGLTDLLNVPDVFLPKSSWHLPTHFFKMDQNNALFMKFHFLITFDFDFDFDQKKGWWGASVCIFLSLCIGWNTRPSTWSVFNVPIGIGTSFKNQSHLHQYASSAHFSAYCSIWSIGVVVNQCSCRSNVSVRRYDTWQWCWSCHDLFLDDLTIEGLTSLCGPETPNSSFCSLLFS